MTTDNYRAPDHNHETTMDTAAANPAYYGVTLSASAGIPIDTNIAYGMINPITATNSAQQQDETAMKQLPTQPLKMQ